MTIYLHNQRKEQVRELESRAEAEDQKKKLIELGMSPDNLAITTEDPRDNTETKSDGGSQDVEVVDNDHGQEVIESVESEIDAAKEKRETDALDEAAEAVDELQANVDTDPLDVLPGYMITMVDGKPSLNKRGISVLAYHYDIDVKEREVVAYPHETEYETAVVEIMVEGPDGRTFSGIGEAHVDETPKHQLLRMSETRAYKRAVIFATGTGIVGYQEMVGSLE